MGNLAAHRIRNICRLTFPSEFCPQLGFHPQPTCSRPSGSPLLSGWVFSVTATRTSDRSGGGGGRCRRQSSLSGRACHPRITWPSPILAPCRTPSGLRIGRASSNQRRPGPILRAEREVRRRLATRPRRPHHRLRRCQSDAAKSDAGCFVPSVRQLAHIGNKDPR